MPLARWAKAAMTLQVARWAKAAMTLQALSSLFILGLMIARAVNILK